MAPFQTAVTLNTEDNRDGQEVIEVQILPQVNLLCIIYDAHKFWNSSLYIIVIT